MKNIAKALKDQAFKEHIDEMQLALFKDKKLNEKEKQKVFKHLSQCKRCRDVLHLASEIKVEDENKLQPANNIDYKGVLKRFGSVVAIFIVFFSVPQIYHQFDAPVFKGFMEEKNIFVESIEYWEKLFEKYFGGNEG